MANHQRGVYEPGEDVRVFDGSEEDEDAEGSRLPLLIVLALLVLAMFGGVVWLAYTQGVARGRTETPVLAAANGPARIAPANPGGADQPYKGFKIYEQPAPPDEDTASPAKTADQPAALSPPPATKPAIMAAAPPPAKAAAPEAKPVAPPAPKPAPKPAAPSSLAAATPPARSPAPAAPAKPAPVPAPSQAATPAPVAAGGAYVLQIGAYKSQADADAAWKAYSRAHAALLSGYGPDVQKADLGDKGTWYRLRIAGFSDKEAASALCDRLKAEQGACFLGK